MLRALGHAWTVFLFCWRHRRAWQIVSETRADYPVTESEVLDWEWKFAQMSQADDDDGGAK